MNGVILTVKNKISIVKSVRNWGFSAICLFGIVAMLLLTYKAHHNFSTVSGILRTDYLEQQKVIIQNEVLRVFDMIHHERIKNSKMGNPDFKKNQEELLQKIARIRFGRKRNGYIFVVHYNGTTLVNDTQRHLIGKNLWNFEDPTGIKVIQEEYRAVQNANGDFIYYSWLNPANHKVLPKISFVKGIRDWEWMIGAGAYISDVEEKIATVKSQYQKETKNQLLLVVVTVIIIVIAFSFLFSLMIKKLKKDMEVFSNFFDDAALHNNLVDTGKIRFTECDRLAIKANKMIDDRLKMQRELEDERIELSNVRKLESLGILAGGIAHDFNNILTAIFGNIELAKMKIRKDDPAGKFIDNSRKALIRATDLTKQLLTFAKGGDPILELVDLKSIVKTTVKFNMSGSNVKTYFLIPDELWHVKVDQGQISQVIANITINAKQAMPDGGCFHV